MASLFTLTLVQILVAVLLFVALLNGQRDLITLTLLVLGVLGGARLWARFSLARLHHRSTMDRQRVFPNEPVTLTIDLANAKLLPIWLRVAMPIGNLLVDSSNAQTLKKETSLFWFQHTQARWQLLAPRRGVYQIGPLDLIAGDLFSFFSRSVHTTEIHSLVVYPRLIALKHFALPRRDFFGVPQVTSPVQDPIYILGTRDYQAGQPSKYIHWKASARHTHLQEKIFESTVQEKILLVVNAASFAQHDAKDEFERALEIAASIAVHLDRQRHAVGLIADGATNGPTFASVPVARTDQQLASILESLARLELTSSQNINDHLRQKLADTWGVTCVYLAYQIDANLKAASEYMKRRHFPVMFCVSLRSVTELAIEFSHKVYAFDELAEPMPR